MMRVTGLVTILTAALAASDVLASSDELLTFSIAQRALESPGSLTDVNLKNEVASQNDDRPSKRRMLLRKTGARHNSEDIMSPSIFHRDLLSEANTCDVAFLQCITADACANCFLEMETEDINWAGVTDSTPCPDVVGFLNNGKHCNALKGDQNSITTFCDTFKSCVVWFDEGDADDEHADDIDCSKLTECNWDGFHPSFIGNGVCNDGMDGCYNTEICGYDSGDCCEDTCKTDGEYVTCGKDGFSCKDPASSNCDSALSTKCDPSKTAKKDEDVDPSKITCKDDEALFRIVMYDSFGDGWDATKLAITPVGQTSNVIYSGGLKEGTQGTDYVCLSKNPACYHVDAKGGIWGKEISWEVKPITEGSPALAGGGSPMECNFGVAGGDCESTCTGKPNIKPSDDPGYKQLKDLFKCVDEKCLIQVGACRKDEVCDGCFHADPEDYCYANDAFTAVADCTLCQCTDTKNADFCQKKVSPGSVLPPNPPADGGKTLKAPCTPAETVSGGTAVIKFSQCVNYEQVAMMVTDFNQNNFGDLDKFESCAHSFTTADHGGHTALGCLQILVNAMNGASAVENKDSTPTEAIKSLAMSLYKDAANFCDCAKVASDQCPLCPSFMNFKTLLFESLDACKSLDEIDCDAWKEFHPSCQKNMVDKFGSVNFNKEEQCTYIRDNCGGVGPFPAFRRLDCDKEVSADAWSFYQQYSKSCLKGEPLPPQPQPQPKQTEKPTEKPAPVPTPSDPQPAPAPTPTPPNPKPYVPPEDNPSGSKPYVPPENKDSSTPKPYVPSDSSSSSSSYIPQEKKKGKSWFWTFVFLSVLVGGVYVYFKRRSEGFNFIRYRRMRNNFRDDSDMYSGLALESSTNFEPPHLPPTPAAMGGIQ